jgi:hypothetical protein
VWQNQEQKKRGKNQTEKRKNRMSVKVDPLEKSPGHSATSFQLLGHVSSHAGQMMVLDITQIA